MMLHGRDEDFITGPNVASAETGGDEIDPLGGAADENDFARLGGIQEALHGNTGLFIFLRGQLTEKMNAAMNVGIFLAIESIQGVDDKLGFLRCGRIIKVDKRLAVHFATQNWKVAADLPDVEGKRCLPGTARSSFRNGAHTSSSNSGRSGACRPAKRASSRWARIGSTLIRPMMSLAKAKVSRLRASSRPMPRERR